MITPNSVEQCPDDPKKIRLIFTTYCCKQPATLVVDRQQYANWRLGTFVQFAFRDMSIEDRELLISGTCSKCWDEMFKGEEE